MNFIINKNFSKGLAIPEGVEDLNVDTSLVKFLLNFCPNYRATNLTNSNSLAKSLKIRSVYLKDERERFNLGSFKATGATYAIAKMAYKLLDNKRDVTRITLGETLKPYTFVTASAGNHGISMAVGARLFGSKAVVFLSETVPKSFSSKLESYGARVIFSGKDYEESMKDAEKYSNKKDHVLLSDSTWDTCSSGVDVMEGYLILVEEIFDQLAEAKKIDSITHVFLQAGVGGFAAAMAALIRKKFQASIQIIVVEPSSANTLFQSIKNQKPTKVRGKDSIMGRLDCKEPSLSAFYSLSSTANYFMHISDEYVQKKILFLDRLGVKTSASGGAGLAGLIYASSNQIFGINKNSQALIFLTEGVISN